MKIDDTNGTLASIIAQALSCIPVTDNDRKSFGTLIDKLPTASFESKVPQSIWRRISDRFARSFTRQQVRIALDKSIISLADELGIEFTQGLWTLLMSVIAQLWAKRTVTDEIMNASLMLPIARENRVKGNATAADSLLDRAAEALEALASTTCRGEDVKMGSSWMLKKMYELSLAASAMGRSDQAFDIAAFTVDLFPAGTGGRETLIQHTLSLATAADRADQITACTVSLAEEIAYAADRSPKRRLETFDTCEVAIERLRGCVEPVRQILIDALRSIIREREYLAKLDLPLLLLQPKSKWPAQAVESLSAFQWPERVSSKPSLEWSEDLFGDRSVLIWDTELDNDRLQLEPVVQMESANTDWISWTIDHPAYLRSVPSSRSFLRESQFDTHFLVLTHEITHVVCLAGGIGMMLTVLRVAALRAELAMWVNSTPELLEEHPDVHSLFHEMQKEGIASIPNSQVVSLVRAEVALELTRKMEILQDVWTPWLEGVAIFGEVAADPQSDPATVGFVTECLRNLIDLDIARQSNGNFEAADGELTAFVTEFETMCAGAIASKGPDRLETYMRRTDVPYFAGYLAVRSVVAAWRATARRPISGAEIFRLLVFVTRHGTPTAVPDLSLRSELFATAAHEMMLEWTCSLGKLTRQEIDDFLSPPNRNQPRLYKYDSGRLSAVNADEVDRAIPDQDTLIETRVREAFNSLTNPEDQERLSTIGQSRLIANESAAALKDSAASSRSIAWGVRQVQSDLALGHILPIGRTDAKFYVNIDQADNAQSRLSVVVRSTEALRSTGKASVNTLILPIDSEAASRIDETYRKTGQPRLRVTRVIDLAGFITASIGQLAGTHLLAYSYGDWFEIKGPTTRINDVIDMDSDQRASLRNLIRHRLQPSGVEKAEIDLISKGHEGARRTREWIDQSSEWLLEDIRVDVEAWVGRVRELSNILVEGTDRGRVQSNAARALLGVLFQDATVASGVVDRGFVDMTSDLTEMRGEIVKSLFETALVSGPNDFLTNHVASLEAANLRIFCDAASGWDVKPAMSAPREDE